MSGNVISRKKRKTNPRRDPSRETNPIEPNENESKTFALSGKRGLGGKTRDHGLRNEPIAARRRPSRLGVLVVEEFPLGVDLRLQFLQAMHQLQLPLGHRSRFGRHLGGLLSQSGQLLGLSFVAPADGIVPRALLFHDHNQHAMPLQG
jgi:hypothetical protein